MNRSAFSAFVVIAAVAGSFQNANAQAVNATMQTGAPRAVASRSAPAPKAFGVARPAIAPQVARATGLAPQSFNANPPRMIAQPPVYLQRTYSPTLRSANPELAALNTQRAGPVQQPVSLDPARHQTEVRTLAAMRQRRGIVTRDGNILDPATRQDEIRTLSAVQRTLQKMRENQGFGSDNRTLATIDPQQHVTNLNPEAGPQGEKPEGPKDHHGKKWHDKKGAFGFDAAFSSHWHEWHDRNWWHDHCQTIVFVNTGYYFLDGSYWYPAYGYDPMQTYYDYDGPVYTYSNLLPDEVIANVQTALQDAGYYFGQITGSLGVDTRAAIANFQRDSGLQITGAIDEDTVGALGLY